MDSRGFGRLRPLSRAERRITATLTLLGLLIMSVGGYALLDAGTSPVVSTAMLLTGLALLGTGMRRANRRAVRTVYRPDPWRWPETWTVAAGVVALVAFTAQAWLDPTTMLPATAPLVWPSLPLLPLVAVLAAAAPAWIAPPVPAAVGTTDVGIRTDAPTPRAPHRVAA
jgi:energy-coupling factor transport system permease protein